MSGATATPLPASLARNPRLDRWLAFGDDGVLTVRSGKVEIGQGILGALAQIVADELGYPLASIRMQAASTDSSPDEAVTSGSLSIQDSGAALRQACAEALALLRDAAAAYLDCDAASLEVQAGAFVAPDGRREPMWRLAQGGLLARDAAGHARPRPVEARVLVGTRQDRPELADKIHGRARFIHDLCLPGMAYARVLHGPRPDARLEACDEAAARSSPGIRAVLRDGNLVGVVGVDTASVDRAFDRLAASARWVGGEPMPESGSLADWLRGQPATRTVIAEPGAPPPADAPVRTFRARYSRPFIAHAAIAPSCAIARAEADGRLKVWTHSQGIYNLRRDLAIAFAIAEDAIVVTHVEGSGCYGHNGADDVAFDAAWLARALPGVPVRVQWSRADELTRSPIGAAMAIDIEAEVSGDAMRAWRTCFWSNGHSSRPGRAAAPTLLGASQTASPFVRPIAIDMPPATGGGADRNAIPGYDIGAIGVIGHRLRTMPVRTSALRSLGAFAQVFAIESMVDEIACALGVDPLAWRLRHLSDPRARRVLERAAAGGGWHRPGPERAAMRAQGVGLGLGWARYKGTGAWCAVLAEVEVAVEARVRRLAIAVDVGLAVNPDGVVNQIEGGAIQACSWTLKEAMPFDDERLLGDSWDAYPILRFSEVPSVEVDVVESTDASLGAGEASMGPTAAAIANALHDALGVRVRDLPLTPARIADAIAAMD
ncbi:MAG: molybdopterin cofactor-binding domain-containing protein [Lautropia sp.]